jgi:hypothetical protein
MSYLGSLIHTAKVERANVVLNELNERRNDSYPTASGMSAVPCLLTIGAQRQIENHFGHGFRADGLIHFPAETDIRPNATSPSGNADRITVTDEAGVVTVWYVAASRDPGGVPRRAIVVAVRKNAQ